MALGISPKQVYSEINPNVFKKSKCQMSVHWSVANIAQDHLSQSGPQSTDYLLVTGLLRANFCSLKVKTQRLELCHHHVTIYLSLVTWSGSFYYLPSVEEPCTVVVNLHFNLRWHHEPTVLQASDRKSHATRFT